MARSKKRAAPRVLQWFTQAQFFLLIEGGDEKLFVGVQPGKDGWMVLALASKANAESAHDVLANHGHKLVGQYPSIVKAMTAGESYARAWAKGHKAARVGECPCDELPKPRRGK